MEISVIFTTYNSPEYLEKVLWGFAAQSFKDFEVIIADDGSTSQTAELILAMQEQLDFPIKHVWQEDDGFRKTKILNKAILASQAEYLVFTDGDCIPRADFLETHYKFRKAGHFLSGGLSRLPLQLSQAITKEDILQQRCFDLEWLKAQGLETKFLKDLKLTKSASLASFLNKVTPTKASWNGHNASTWRKNILSVNGFDERMKYGGEDREFGERLVNAGIKPIQIRYSAICVHLDHSRGYDTTESIAFNKNLRKYTKEHKITRTPYGIEKMNQ